MLWVCVLLPQLPVEVFTRSRKAANEAAHDLRFAITTGGHYPRIVTANEAARSAGLAAGQLVSASLALAPDVVLRERDIEAEAAALAGIATWLTQFTPAVSIAEPPAVLAEIGGSLRLFGGFRALLQQIVRGVQALGYSVRAACAPTPTAARLLARAGHARAVMKAEQIAVVLAPLALAHLGADENAVALLRAAGITTFGAACALPRDALARRAGADFVSLLDRARALAPDPQVPFVPPARYQGRLELPVPIAEVEALGFAVNRLVHEMSGWLLGRGLGVLELSVAMEHERYVAMRTGARTTSIRFALASPAREPAHLAAVLRERLARVALPAAVESIVLASESTAPLGGHNFGLLPGDDAAASVPLLDRLRARLGDDAVVCVTPLPEHRPERAWREQPPGSFCSARGKSQATAAALPLAPAPRPLWLLEQAQPLAATFEHKPWILRDGPERIESGWWDGGDIRRDYYVAESPRGERLWIYRDSVYGEDGEWFLQGIFA